MNGIKAGLASIATAALIAGGVVASAQVKANSEPTPVNPTPAWMHRSCAQEDSVNCYWDGGSYKPSQGEAYVRQMPGRRHMVCVFFVNTPRRDYCA